MSAPRFSELNHRSASHVARVEPVALHSRVRVMFLQKSRGRILSYELLVSNETIYGQIVSRMVALGLILISVGIMLLPKSALESAWFPAP